MSTDLLVSDRGGGSPVSVFEDAADLLKEESSKSRRRAPGRSKSSAMSRPGKEERTQRAPTRTKSNQESSVMFALPDGHVESSEGRTTRTKRPGLRRTQSSRVVPGKGDDLSSSLHSDSKGRRTRKPKTSEERKLANQELSAKSWHSSRCHSDINPISLYPIAKETEEEKKPADDKLNETSERSSSRRRARKVSDAGKTGPDRESTGRKQSSSEALSSRSGHSSKTSKTEKIQGEENNGEKKVRRAPRRTKSSAEKKTISDGDKPRRRAPPRSKSENKPSENHFEFEFDDHDEIVPSKERGRRGRSSDDRSVSSRRSTRSHSCHNRRSRGRSTSDDVSVSSSRSSRSSRSLSRSRHRQSSPSGDGESKRSGPPVTKRTKGQKKSMKKASSDPLSLELDFDSNTTGAATLSFDDDASDVGSIISKDSQFSSEPTMMQFGDNGVERTAVSLVRMNSFKDFGGSSDEEERSRKIGAVDNTATDSVLRDSKNNGDILVEEPTGRRKLGFGLFKRNNNNNKVGVEEEVEDKDNNAEPSNDLSCRSTHNRLPNFGGIFKRRNCVEEINLDTVSVS